MLICSPSPHNSPGVTSLKKPLHLVRQGLEHEKIENRQNTARAAHLEAVLYALQARIQYNVT